MIQFSLLVFLCSIDNNVPCFLLYALLIHPDQVSDLEARNFCRDENVVSRKPALSMRLRSGVIGDIGVIGAPRAGDELTVEYVRVWLALVEAERTLDDDGETTDPSKDSACGLVYNGPDGSISTDSASKAG